MTNPDIASPTEQFELSLSFLLDAIAAQLRRRKRNNNDPGVVSRGPRRGRTELR
jgi:hypothetical protein